MVSSSRRVRRFVLAGITRALALLLGGGAFVHLRAESSWQQMLAAEASLRAELMAAPHRRTPLWGEAHEGSAFAAYEEALALTHTLMARDDDELLATLRDTDEQVAARRAELRARWAPAVALLRTGAHAADTAPLRGSARDEEAAPANLLQCRWLANAAVFEARAARHAGRGVDAVRHTLDAATLGVDLLRRGVLIDQMIGGAIVVIGTAEAWPEPALARLDRAALDELAAGLERLDAMLPEHADFTGELVFLARQLRTLAPDEPWLPSGLAGWRFGFSARWMLADAFTCWAGTVRELAATTAHAWPLRRATLELEGNEAAASGNPVLAMVVPNVVAAEASLRQVVALVRLLRMAVDRHRGLDLPPLRDPLGDGPIQVTRTGDEIQLRCAGADERANLQRVVRLR